MSRRRLVGTFRCPGDYPFFRAGAIEELALIWFLWTSAPYIVLSLGGRVTYPFYFIPAIPIPAVVIGASFLLTKRWFPFWPAVFVGVSVFGACFVFFIIFFPDKALLPVWLRAAIGY